MKNQDVSKVKAQTKSAILLAANYSNITGYAWNNIYQLFNVIAREFLSRDYNIVICFSKIEGIVNNFDPDLNINFIEFDPNNHTPKNTFKLLKLIGRHHIKNIYFTDQRSFDYRYAFIRLAGVKKIVVHNRISVSDPNPALYEGGLRGTVKNILGCWNFINADRIYAVSDFVKNRLIVKNRIPEHRIVKILNGINIDKFKPKLVDEYLSSGNSIKIFSGGRATFHKGIDVLIEATALLKKRTKAVFEVRYAGDGPDMASFRIKVEQLKLDNCFIFLGELESTLEEVSKADIIVVPSIWGDACPSSVSEALAAGKPLIATAVGGVPEIVGSEDNAALINPDNPEMLFDALERLLTSVKLRESMSKNARARAEFALDQRLYYKKVINQLLIDYSY